MRRCIDCESLAERRIRRCLESNEVVDRYKRSVPRWEYSGGGELREARDGLEGECRKAWL